MLSKEIQTCISVVSEANQNLSELIKSCFAGTIDWPTSIPIKLSSCFVPVYLLAVKQVVYVFNCVPSVETGIYPLDKFTSQRFQQSKLHDLHVWTSNKHANTVPLVLNPESGVISLQFHVVVDKWFAAIALSTGEIPDFTKEDWMKLFGENDHHYIWDEETDKSKLKCNCDSFRCNEFKVQHYQKWLWWNY
jgi:hypothetical protein